MGKLINFLFNQYVFLIFSGDINEKRRHVHITDKGFTKLCKFWIEFDQKTKIELENNKGFTKTELTQIKKLITAHIELINKQLDNFYNHKKVKIINL